MAQTFFRRYSAWVFIISVMLVVPAGVHAADGEGNPAIRELLVENKEINEQERRVYSEVIDHYLPRCAEEDSHGTLSTIHDVVWLREFNGDYLAVSLIRCGWDELDAFILDSKGKLKGRFKLPAGKYWPGPPYELNVSDYTGDGKQELYFRITFPTSSVPVFHTLLRLYKQKPGESVPRIVLEMKTEQQDCFEAERRGDNVGSRHIAELQFIPDRGLLKVTEQRSEFRCDDFSWGEEPVRTLRVLSEKTKTLRWDEKGFLFVPVE